MVGALRGWAQSSVIVGRLPLAGLLPPLCVLSLPGPVAALRHERASLVIAASVAADLRGLRFPVPLSKVLYRGLRAPRSG